MHDARPALTSAIGNRTSGSHWKSRIRRRFASIVTRCIMTCTKSLSRQSTTQAAQAYEQPVRIAMCPTNGPIRSPVRCKLQKKFGAHYSAPSTRGKNFSTTESDSPSMNGLACNRMIHSNAGTATISLIWTSPRRARARPPNTRNISRPEKRPTSIVTKASPIRCLTWPM